MNDTYLVHHGILGQKWGVRRFENPDGTLTEAGKKRYYQKDKYGFDRLTKEGYKYNEESRQKANQYANSVKYNLQKVNPEYDNKLSEYKNLHKQDHEHFISEREKWFNQTDYKKKDWYQFKDISRDRWLSTEAGKKETTTWKDIENLVRSAAKEHPLFTKEFDQLKETYIEEFDKGSMKKRVQYGEYVVNKIMNSIRSEVIESEHK